MNLKTDIISTGVPAEISGTSPTSTSVPEDSLVLVNFADQAIGSAPKLETHRRRLLHRAFSVFLTDGDRMLIHRRADGKYHSGGLWTNSCCSHPRFGEELADSVHRRMMQELGVDTAVRELFHFIYYQDYGDLAEYELDHVFLGHLDETTEIPYDPEEIGALRWISADDLEREMREDPGRFTAWFLIAAPGVLEIMRTS